MDGHSAPPDDEIADYMAYLAESWGANLTYQIGLSDNVPASILAEPGAPLQDLIPPWTEIVPGSSATATRLSRLPTGGWRELSSSATRRRLATPSNLDKNTWLLVSLFKSQTVEQTAPWVIHASETPVRQLPSRLARRQHLTAKLLPEGAGGPRESNWRLSLRNEGQQQWMNVAADSCRATLRIRDADEIQIVGATDAGYKHVTEDDHPPIPTLMPGESFTVPPEHVSTTFAVSDIAAAASIEGHIHSLDLIATYTLH